LPASSELVAGTANRSEGFHDKAEAHLEPHQVEFAHEPGCFAASLILHEGVSSSLLLCFAHLELLDVPIKQRFSFILLLILLAVDFLGLNELAEAVLNKRESLALALELDLVLECFLESRIQNVILVLHVGST